MGLLQPFWPASACPLDRMSRDYSQFLPSNKLGSAPKPEKTFLQLHGWQPFFSQQTTVEEIEETPPVRVTRVHRNGCFVLGDGIEMQIPPGPDATVGDWLLLDQILPSNSRVLERKSVFKRRAPGHDRRFQLIASNVDTAFIVSSCNQDFNVARLERYIALAFEADVEPIIILTKADLCDDPEPYVTQSQAISDRATVVLLNALSDEPIAKLADWCKTGQTVAFLGSSGVGKSTLVNALFGEGTADTAGIREDDARGRHTTTSRHLRFTAEGCGILDTPGMREIQMADAEAGIANLFGDLTELALQCKFNDCSHEVEPGCAIRKAVDDGRVDRARYERWQKLAAEDKFNSTSFAERKADAKAFGKVVKSAVKHKKRQTK